MLENTSTSQYLQDAYWQADQTMNRHQKELEEQDKNITHTYHYAQSQMEGANQQTITTIRFVNEYLAALTDIGQEGRQLLADVNNLESLRIMALSKLDDLAQEQAKARQRLDDLYNQYEQEHQTAIRQLDRQRELNNR
ncbi:Uncharacterised protein [Scardovia inopinata]|uniref:Uncharacterized protein n=1 Tax=Scardovia inopinata F0304 TaxID=641146 RepID=W5IGS9_SCAIO|nr:hypothetical protein [Scardovia inopinata]EFG26041.1 hypothetical protein HMPREF9020_01113 [Scardovia inopinata F0304]BAR07326.1 hypothetical protein SCIP_1259 [Scardovia inopinata JCM 12537]SUV51403.1 Uncharacterised protein [Scardovia inopinata]